jgi:hypothetical protein
MTAREESPCPLQLSHRAGSPSHYRGFMSCFPDKKDRRAAKNAKRRKKDQALSLPRFPFLRILRFLRLKVLLVAAAGRAGCLCVLCGCPCFWGLSLPRRCTAGNDMTRVVVSWQFPVVSSESAKIGEICGSFCLPSSVLRPAQPGETWVPASAGMTTLGYMFLSPSFVSFGCAGCRWGFLSPAINGSTAVSRPAGRAGRGVKNFCAMFTLYSTYRQRETSRIGAVVGGR